MKYYLNAYGYWTAYMPKHPRASRSNGTVFVHILVAEKVLGKSLPQHAEVHHWRTKNDNDKLVVCENHAYHHLLHQRAEALATTGHANWRKCVWCSKYSDPDDPKSEMTVRSVKSFPDGNGQSYHRSCPRNAAKDRYRRTHKQIYRWR